MAPSDLTPPNRSVQKPPYAVFICVGPDSESAFRWVFKNSLHETVVDFARAHPAMLEPVRFYLLVVIHGEEVLALKRDMVVQILNETPDPKDPNWMGFSVTRGSGRTSKQMKDAPEGAAYVWPNGDLTYPIQLAKSLGREDLGIVQPAWLTRTGLLEVERKYRGLDIVLDHACRLTPEQRRTFEINERKRMKYRG